MLRRGLQTACLRQGPPQSQTAPIQRVEAIPGLLHVK